MLTILKYETEDNQMNQKTYSRQNAGLNKGNTQQWVQTKTTKSHRK